MEAPVSLRPLVDGPRRAAVVVSRGPWGCYLLDRTRPTVTAVVTRRSTCPPNALVLGAVGAALVPRVAPGDPATVGGGGLEVAGHRLRVARWVDRRLVLPPLDAAIVGSAVDEVAVLLAAAPPVGDEDGRALLADVAEALAREGRGDALGPAVALLGRGPGLTPTGDDLLAGLVSAVRTTAVPLSCPAVGAAAAHLAHRLGPVAARRTTALSATLLGHAARGELLPAARRLLLALTGRTPARPAVAALLAVGHTSGRDLAEGLLTGVQAVLAAHAHTRTTEETTRG